MIALKKETEELAKLLAERTGNSPAEVIRQALEERARRSGIAMIGSGYRRPNVGRMLEISDRFAHLPVLDTRSPDDIGVPR